MAFSLPVFNLTCDIYTGPWATRVLRVPSAPCNLAWGKRTGPKLFFIEGDVAVNGVQTGITLLCPALTDLRSFPTYPQSDMIEVPVGSGRWYTAIFVDDIGKGFANEHRAAELGQISETVDNTRFAGLTWPTPMT